MVALVTLKHGYANAREIKLNAVNSPELLFSRKELVELVQRAEQLLLQTSEPPHLRIPSNMIGVGLTLAGEDGQKDSRVHVPTGFCDDHFNLTYDMDLFHETSNLKSLDSA